jgi:4-amino-4-deoxy-L-arabinose transferase-like glycosyltransferase
LSYYDHPPLAWWLVALMRHVTTTDDAFILRLPFIGLSVLSTGLMFDFTNQLYGRRAAEIAVVLFSAAPVLSLTSAVWILPDGPLLAAMLGCGCCLARLFFAGRHSPLLWLAGGVCGGLALVSKYHGLFLFLGTFVFLLSVREQRFWLVRPWPYVASLLALLIFAPVLVWNMRHEWASLVFQSHRAMAVDVKLWMPLLALAGQALFLCPPVWFVVVKATCKRIWQQPRDGRDLLVFCLGIGPILIVLLTSLWTRQSLFHWAAPGYMMLFPLAGHYLSPQRLAWLLPTHGVVWLLALVVALGSVVPAHWSAYGLRDPYADMRSWRSLQTLLAPSVQSLPSPHFIAATRWHLAGRVDEAFMGQQKISCLCEDAREYGIIAPLSSLLHQSALILVPAGRADLTLEHLRQMFGHAEQQDDVSIRRGDDELISFHVFRGDDFRGIIAAPHE